MILKKKDIKICRVTNIRSLVVAAFVSVWTLFQVEKMTRLIFFLTAIHLNYKRNNSTYKKNLIIFQITRKSNSNVLNNFI
jgi:hypothetical protein